LIRFDVNTWLWHMIECLLFMPFFVAWVYHTFGIFCVIFICRVCLLVPVVLQSSCNCRCVVMRTSCCIILRCQSLFFFLFIILSLIYLLLINWGRRHPENGHWIQKVKTAYWDINTLIACNRCCPARAVKFNPGLSFSLGLLALLSSWSDNQLREVEAEVYSVSTIFLFFWKRKWFWDYQWIDNSGIRIWDNLGLKSIIELRWSRCWYCSFISILVHCKLEIGMAVLLNPFHDFMWFVNQPGKIILMVWPESDTEGCDFLFFNLMYKFYSYCMILFCVYIWNLDYFILWLMYEGAYILFL
jgi:hypothetical protein